MADSDTTTKTGTLFTGTVTRSIEPQTSDFGPRTRKFRDWALAHDQTVWENFKIRVYALGLSWDENNTQFLSELGRFEALLPLFTETETVQTNRSDNEAVQQLTREKAELDQTAAQIQKTDVEKLVSTWTAKLKEQGFQPAQLEEFQRQAQQRFATELKDLEQLQRPPDAAEIQTRITNAAIASLNLPRDKTDASYTREALGQIRRIQSIQSEKETNRITINIKNAHVANTILSETKLPPAKKPLVARVLVAQLKANQDTPLDLAETAGVVQAIEALSQPLVEVTGDKTQTNASIDALTMPGWQRQIIKQISNNPLLTNEGRKKIITKLTIESFEKTIQKAGMDLASAQTTKQLFIQMQQTPPPAGSGVSVAQKTASLLLDPFNAVFSPLAKAAARDDNTTAVNFAKALEYKKRFGMAVFVSPTTIETPISPTTFQPVTPAPVSQKDIHAPLPPITAQPPLSQSPATSPLSQQHAATSLFSKDAVTVDQTQIPPGMIAVVLQGTNQIPPPIVYLPASAAGLSDVQIQDTALAVYALQLLPQATSTVSQSPQVVDQVLGISHIIKDIILWLSPDFLQKAEGSGLLSQIVQTGTQMSGIHTRSLGTLAKLLGFSAEIGLFFTTGGAGNIVKTAGVALGKLLFFNQLLDGILSFGGKITGGLGGVGSVSRPVDRRSWLQKIGLGNLLAILPMVLIVALLVPTGIFGLGLDMIVNVDPVTKLATAGIGLGGETGDLDLGSKLIVLSKKANPSAIPDNNPTTITYTISAQPKNPNDSFKIISVTDTFSALAKSGSPTIPSPIINVSQLESGVDVSYTVQLGSQFRDSIITNTLTVIADVGNAKSEQKSISTSVVVGNPPLACFSFGAAGVNDSYSQTTSPSTGWSADEIGRMSTAIAQIVRSDVYRRQLCGQQNQNAIRLYRIRADFGGGSAQGSAGNIFIYNAGIGSPQSALYTLAHETGHIYNARFMGTYLSFKSLNITGREGAIHTYPNQVTGEFQLTEDFAEMVGIYIAKKYYNSGKWSFDYAQRYPLHYTFARDTVFGGFVY